MAHRLLTFIVGVSLGLAACQRAQTAPIPIPTLPTAGLPAGTPSLTRIEPPPPTPGEPETPAGQTATPPLAITPDAGISPPAAAGIEKTIQFYPGTSSAVFNGRASEGVFDRYYFAAFDGQAIRLDIATLSPAGDVSFGLFPPGGGRPLVAPDAGFFPASWRGALPSTGEYLIEIYALGSGVNYTLQIEISPLEETAGSPSEGYALLTAREIPPYLAEIWVKQSGSDGFWYGQSYALLKRGDQLIDRVEFASGFGELSGQDINGSGSPDLIIETFTGGAHCCFSTVIYELGAEARRVLTTPISNCGGRLADLNGDGVYEFTTCDDSFAYYYCAYAGSPAVAVYLEYDSQMSKYVLANTRYQAAYDPLIAAHLESAQSPDQFLEGWDGTNKCQVLPVVLDYLYAGRPAEGWAILQQLYTEPDAKVFWADIIRVVSRSPLYEPAGTFPEVDLPAAYRIALEAACHPNSDNLILLTAERPNCEQPAWRQPLFWLAVELQNLGLLAINESLLRDPAGCTVDCRLMIQTYDESGEIVSGELHLIQDSMGEFTLVQRVSPAGEPVSGQWALRGDLSWEQR